MPLQSYSPPCTRISRGHRTHGELWSVIIPIPLPLHYSSSPILIRAKHLPFVHGPVMLRNTLGALFFFGIFRCCNVCQNLPQTVASERVAMVLIYFQLLRHHMRTTITTFCILTSWYAHYRVYLERLRIDDGEQTRISPQFVAFERVAMMLIYF